jgi:hypothetical protein
MNMHEEQGRESTKYQYWLYIGGVGCTYDLFAYFCFCVFSKFSSMTLTCVMVMSKISSESYVRF